MSFKERQKFLSNLSVAMGRAAESRREAGGYKRDVREKEHHRFRFHHAKMREGWR